MTGFKPSFGLVSVDGVFPLAPSFDHVGPLARDVAGCVELMQVLAPSLTLPPLAEVRVAVTWADRCEPLVRARLLEAAACFGDVTSIEFPTAETVVPAFMREVAEVHRELYAEQADLYGENIRGKIERCLAIEDAAVAAAVADRETLAQRAERALEGFDLLLAPTLAFVAPAADIVEPEVRGEFTRFTFPFNALGWPALALPAGAAEDGLPASVQLIGRRGADGLVLAAGLVLEAAL